jgi:hypothetical protein
MFWTLAEKFMRLTPWEIGSDINSVLVDGTKQSGGRSSEIFDAVSVYNSLLYRQIAFVLNGETIFGDTKIALSGCEADEVNLLTKWATYSAGVIGFSPKGFHFRLMVETLPSTNN